MSESGDGPSPATPPGDNPTENPSEPTGPEPTAGRAAPAPEEAEEPFQPYLMAPPPAVAPPAAPAPPVPRPTPLDVAVELLPPRVTPAAAASPPVPEPAAAPVPGPTPAEVPQPVAAVEPPPLVPGAEAPPVPGEVVPATPPAPAPQAAPTAPGEAPAAADSEGEWTTVMVRRSAVPTATTTIEAPAPPKKGIIGSLAPQGGGVQTLIMRIGILLLGLIILATVFIGGTTLVSRLRNKAAAPGASPTPTASSQSYYPYSDPKNEFSIRLPNGWNQRQLTVSSTTVPLVIGPQPPFPAQDIMFVGIYPNSRQLGPQDLVPFKDFIEENLGTNPTIVSANPFPVSGLPGYFFVWSTTASPNAPNGAIHAGYYLIDGDRIDAVVLEVQPLTDRTSFAEMLPIFQSSAQSFVSFHGQGQSSPAPLISASPTGTVTPRASASP